MAITRKQTEAAPAAYPAISGVVIPVEDETLEWVWQRIEAHIAHRFTPRQVVWLVEGEGEWTPPLCPVTALSAEKWEMGAWAAATLPEGPYGYELPGDGPYRITATVGGGDVPPAVDKAVTRVANYLTTLTDKDGPKIWATSVTQPNNPETGENGGSYQRPKDWAANALINSGAADLLRPYRRA